MVLGVVASSRLVLTLVVIKTTITKRGIDCELLGTHDLLRAKHRHAPDRGRNLSVPFRQRKIWTGGVSAMYFYEIFNWGLLIVTFAVMIGIGFLSSRKVKDSDEGGFLLAGRSLGAFVGASTIVATGFSGWRSEERRVGE